MIVDPDFPDHWKTRMFADDLGDEMAPIYILRLWAHCQNRRTNEFEDMPDAALKALCRFPGHANKLASSLAASGFVRREDRTLIVCGWDEYNASLIAAWDNGKKGGRPPKKKTQTKPMGYPAETHGKPSANPGETDKRRVEKSREEVSPNGDRADKPPPPLDCEEFMAKWEGYEAYRRQSKMKKLKPVSVRKQWAEMAEWGVMAAIASIDQTIKHGWQGLFEPKPEHTNARPGKYKDAF